MTASILRPTQPANHRFEAPAHRPTTRLIGVEEELLLLNAATLAPIPASTDVLHAHAGVAQPANVVLEAESKLEQIEVVSPPLRTYRELLDAVVSGRRTADQAARMAGARAAALATVPLLCDSHVAPSPRYDLMSERFALTMAEQLTCGFHVHVTIGSPEEGVAILDRIRIWLPLLLALSANSPFWRGADSGYASYRYQAWGRWPSAGPYDLFRSAEAYFATVDQMVGTGVALDAGMVYFDARLSTHAPTVEVRVADVCLLPEDAVTIAVIVRALVAGAAAEWREGSPAPEVPAALLRLASWRASRFGTSENLIHPFTGVPRPARECVGAFLDHINPHFDGLEEAVRAHQGVKDILARGTGAAHQRTLLAEHGNWTDMMAAVVARTHSGGADR
ncbi:glutamate--cysteine ligase [Microbacterium sp. W4I20]|uniref:glutamate--cysteine ligase n=1 Tax=Microbacterium sp. W4I20 TaxID=3042262 RepID=UPI0027843E25|nr:glutamate--cysteine ligase [Microbacterium sp. W4I20]MDQ0729125.1 carboxylate-amine ligase [Microbacterium sp. W4I20]